MLPLRSVRAIDLSTKLLAKRFPDGSKKGQIRDSRAQRLALKARTSHTDEPCRFRSFGDAVLPVTSIGGLDGEENCAAVGVHQVPVVMVPAPIVGQDRRRPGRSRCSTRLPGAPESRCRRPRRRSVRCRTGCGIPLGIPSDRFQSDARRQHNGRALAQVAEFAAYRPVDPKDNLLSISGTGRPAPVSPEPCARGYGLPERI